MRKVNVIHACWLDASEKNFSWCEYCDNNKSNKTYLPFHKNVLNPEHICENCVKNNLEELGIEFEVIDFFETHESYYTELYKLKGDK